jgi:hypothetical protein
VDDKEEDAEVCESGRIYMDRGIECLFKFGVSDLRKLLLYFYLLAK